MKKIILSLLLVICLALLSGCGSTNTTESVKLEEQYYNFAQECIKNGDKEKAIDALKEGVDKTGSKKLSDLLETLKTENESSNSSNSSDSSEAASSEVTSSQNQNVEENTKYKIPDKLLTVLNSTRADTFGSKSRDFTKGGSDCYYSSDGSFVVYYSLDGSALETPLAIEGEIQELIPGKSTYTADEIQNVFSEYKCEKFYSEIDENYSLNVQYDNYVIGFSASSMNNFTAFTISKII